MKRKMNSVVVKPRKRRRGFGSVYKAGGLWYVRVRKNGQEVNEAVGPDKSLAEARLAAICTATWTEHVLGIREVARVTWDEFWPRLNSWLKANHGAVTHAGEVGKGKVVGKFLGSKALVDVTRGDMEMFLAKLRTTPGLRCKNGLSKAATNRYRAFVSVAFQRAVEAGFARSNPVAGIKSFKEQERPVPYLAPEDIDKILARAPLQFRPFLTLSADTGCRRSELLALAWTDVHLADGAIVVRESKNNSSRRIPLTPRALDVLKALDKAKAPGPLNSPATVFPALYGSQVSKAWADAAKTAGFAGLRLHDARHGFASGLARAGVAPGVIGTLIGDKTPSVVFRYCRHAPLDAAAEGVALLAKARGQNSDPKTEAKTA